MGDNIARARRSRPKWKLFSHLSIEIIICMIHNLQVRRGYKILAPKLRSLASFLTWLRHYETHVHRRSYVSFPLSVYC
jgi:hypothetical protein